MIDHGVVGSGMGVNGLWAFLKKKCPGAFREVNKEDLQQTLALDAAMLFTTCLKVTAQDSPEVEWIENYIDLFVCKLRQMNLNGCNIKVVIDGVAPVEKQHAHKKRRKAGAQAVERLQQARMDGDQDAVLRAVRGVVRVTSKMKQMLIQLLQELGFDVVVAPAEAEQHAAELNIQGEVHGVISEDGDTLVSGARRLYRGFCLAQQKPQIVELAKVLETLELTPRQFQWMAVLAGTDFHPGLENVGPVKGTAIARQFQDDQSLLNALECSDETKAGLQAAIQQFGVWDMKEAPARPRAIRWNECETIKAECLQEHYEGWAKNRTPPSGGEQFSSQVSATTQLKRKREVMFPGVNVELELQQF